MKTNLETFPYLGARNEEFPFNRFYEWKDDFEADIIARNKYIEKTEIESKSDGDSQFWRGYVQRGREILGK